jgi:hypothetical protein
MMLNTSYCLNAPNCISEEIEGDLIVINLSTGRYYNMRGPSVRLWQMLAEGILPSLISEANKWNATQLSLMIRFLESLIEEGLLVKNDAQAQYVAPEGLLIQTLDDNSFHMDVFTDMEEILGLDPIHEADTTDAGWPTKAD